MSDKVDKAIEALKHKLATRTYFLQAGFDLALALEFLDDSEYDQYVERCEEVMKEHQ